MSLHIPEKIKPQWAKFQPSVHVHISVVHLIDEQSFLQLSKFLNVCFLHNDPRLPVDGVPLVDYMRRYTGELWVLAARVVLVFTNSCHRRACRLVDIHIRARFGPSSVHYSRFVFGRNPAFRISH